LTEWIVCIALATGTLFVAVGALGLIRLPDVYSRMHAVTKATTLGMAGMVCASALFFAARGESVFGELLTLWLVFLTNPVGGHMIAKSAYLIGIPLAEVSVLDEFGRAGEVGDAAHDMD
jgi:monovalent cation/proton antiporter MnhG/PhaG subunit